MIRDNNPTIHPYRPDPYYLALREAGVQQLRDALGSFGVPGTEEGPDLSFLSDQSIVSLAWTHYKQRSGFQAAIANEMWEEAAKLSGFFRELQDGLQKVDLARSNLD